MGEAEWRGNSPDLNPIEYLWSILKGKLDETESAINLNELSNRLESAWASIDRNILENLVASMPQRIKSASN